MTPAAVSLLAWLWSVPQLSSPRRANTAIAVAQAASETDAPRFWAAILDVWADGETRGSDDPTVSGGCPGVPVGTFCANGRYVSPWMLQRALVPRGASLLDEARIAIATFRESARECPNYPFALYSTGQCAPSRLVDARVARVMAEMSWAGPP